MATYNYLLDNFISTPSITNKMLKIYDKNGIQRYTIDINLAVIFYKNNLLIIKSDNQEDITLDFETNAIAISALEKLNTAKKTIATQNGSNLDYYTKDELNQGQLDNRYYTSGLTSSIFSNTGHSHYVTGLTDVQVSGITNGQVLVYQNGLWINSAFTFNMSAFTSNYYSISDLQNSGGSTINWYNINNYPTVLSGYGITDVYTTAQTYNKTEVYTKTEIDTNIYDKTWIDNHFYSMSQSFNSAQTLILFNSYYTSAQTDILLGRKSDTGHTHNVALSGLSDTTISTPSAGQFLTYTGGTWSNTTFNFSNLSNTAHTHSFDSLSSTAHTHTFNSLSSTAHTHDDRYYTQSQINSGSLDSRYYTSAQTNNLLELRSSTGHSHNDLYYTKSEFSGNTTSGTSVLDGRYYTQTWIDNHFYDITQSYNTGETLTLFIPYYNSAQTNNLLELRSSTAHTHLLSQLSGVSINTPSFNQVLVYSGGNWVNASINSTFDMSPYYTSTQTLALLVPYYTSAQTLALFVPYYTSAQTDTLLLNKSNISHSHHFTGLTSTAHTHSWSNITNTPTTLTDYGLSSDAYTQTWIDNHFYSMSQSFNSAETLALFVPYYNSAQTIALFTSYYTSTQTDVLLSRKSNTGHTHDFTGLTNTAHTHNDIYYTKTQIDNTTLPFIPLAGSTGITGDLIPSGSRNLGSLTNPWNKLFVSGGTIYIDNVPISVVNGQLTVSGQTTPTLSTITANFSTTGHNHNDLYYLKTDFSGDTASGTSVLDGRYYTQIWIDNHFNKNFQSFS